MSEHTEAELITPGVPTRPPAGIKNRLWNRLPERGKIKIGEKGGMTTSRQGNEFQPPLKLDHFRITTLNRDPQNANNFMIDQELHDIFGQEPIELPIRLLYDDPSLNFFTRYACYASRTILWCAGDGESALRLSDNPPTQRDLATFRPRPHEVKCTCFRIERDYQGRDKCKPNGNLSVVLDDERIGGIGGVWNFRTTSWNSLESIMATQYYLASQTGGILANLPLTMRLVPKYVVANGQPSTIYYVRIESRKGIGIPQLQEIAHDIALTRSRLNLSIRHIEDEARKYLAAASRETPLPSDESNEDVVDEFYEETAAAEPAPKPEDFVEPPPHDGQEFVVLDWEDNSITYHDPSEALNRLVERLHEAADINKGALEGVWESNQQTIETLASLETTAQDILTETYQQELERFSPPPAPIPPAPTAPATEAAPSSLPAAQQPRRRGRPPKNPQAPTRQARESQDGPPAWLSDPETLGAPIPAPAAAPAVPASAPAPTPPVPPPVTETAPRPAPKKDWRFPRGDLLAYIYFNRVGKELDRLKDNGEPPATFRDWREQNKTDLLSLKQEMGAHYAKLEDKLRSYEQAKG